MKLFVSFALFAALLPYAAMAQSQCAPRGVLVDQLSERFQEAPQAIGLTPQDQVMELWGSDETGTWTIIVTRADGIACLVASGQAFDLLAQPDVPLGEPA